jgi:hypothetical protein
MKTICEINAEMVLYLSTGSFGKSVFLCARTFSFGFALDNKFGGDGQTYYPYV